MALLGDLHADGLTIVFVTHEDDIGARADRVVTMQDGVVVDQGAGA